MKYAWIDTQTNCYALAELCGVLDVSIRGFRAWKRGGTPQRICSTASAARGVELMQVSLTSIASGLYEVSFDCLNADEWFEVCFFATANARSPVEISGRLFGQKKDFP